MPNVVGIKGDDGLYRFYSGSFTDKFKAAQHKVDLTLSGYNDAFIVAFQKGKRISLKDIMEAGSPDSLKDKLQNNLKKDGLSWSKEVKALPPIDETIN